MIHICAISDTHKVYSDIHLEPGDLLIFAGDIFRLFQYPGYGLYLFTKFIKWFGQQPYKYKIFIGGNHDKYLQKHEAYVREKTSEYQNMYYLNNEQLELTINGINLKIYGQSQMYSNSLSKAFFIEKSQAKEARAQIKEDSNIVITHCPPYFEKELK